MLALKVDMQFCCMNVFCFGQIIPVLVLLMTILLCIVSQKAG